MEKKKELCEKKHRWEGSHKQLTGFLDPCSIRSSPLKDNQLAIEFIISGWCCGTMKFCDFETFDDIFHAMKRTAGLYTDYLGRDDLMIQIIALVLSPKINNSPFTRLISSHSMIESHSVMAIPRNSRTLFEMSLPCATNAGFSLSLQPLLPLG